jgi:hypothetical protein
MWNGDIYHKSLRTIIRTLLRIHLAPTRMARYQEVKQRKAKVNQMKRGQDNRHHSRKHQTSRLMHELGMAVINNRPTIVVQKLVEKLQQLLDMPVRNLDEEIQNEDEPDELNIAVHTREEDDIESMEEEDDIESMEEEEEMVTESEAIQETPAKTIRALLAIVRMLTESGKIQRVVTSDDIQRAAFKGTTFTEKEKMVAAKIINFLRPFVQQRADDNQLPAPHILTRAPLAALANIIVTIIGSPSLVRKLAITPLQGSRALHLTAAGIYDVFHEQWDIPVDDTNWITNSYQAGKTKAAVFRAFLNTNKIESLMNSYGLQFAWRLTFVNRWTVRLLGKAKPGKTFVKSDYEARKKGKDRITNPTLAMEMPNLDHSKMKALAETHASQIKELTDILGPLRKELSHLELQRMDIGRRVRNLPWDPGSDLYQQLKSVRKEISTKRLKVIKTERTLANARSSLYALNKALRATEATNTTTTTGNTNPQEKSGKEDYIERVRFIQYYHIFNHLAELFNSLSVSKIDESTSGDQRASLFKQEGHFFWNRSRHRCDLYYSAEDSRIHFC